MRLFIFLLLLSAFLQTSFLQINLCLILLISRSFAYEESENYYAALFGGLLLGFLSTANLGFWPIVFLLVVKLAHLIRRLPITANFLTVIPASLLIILVSSYVESLSYKTTINFVLIVLEAVLALPIYLLIRYWEERFVVKPELKLKIRG